MLWAEVVRFDLAEDGLVRDALPKGGVRGIGTFRAALDCARSGRAAMYAPPVARAWARESGPPSPDARIGFNSRHRVQPQTSMTRKDGDRRHARGSRLAPPSIAAEAGPRIEPDPAVRRRRSRWRKTPGAFYRLRRQRREVRPDTSALLDGENLDLMVAHQDDIARGSADWSPRPRAGAPESARNARRLHLLEASFGFQCSAHSSDGEFPLEL